MHVAEVVVGIDSGDIYRDVADGMGAVDNGDDVVGAQKTSEGCNWQNDRGVCRYVADDAASDVQRGGVGLEKGSQGLDERGVALKWPLHIKIGGGGGVRDSGSRLVTGMRSPVWAP